MLATEIAFNTMGLAVDIVGAILLFTHGPPPGVISRKAGAVIIWPTGNEEQEQREINRHIRIGRLAICLIVFGFALQLIAPALRPH